MSETKNGNLDYTYNSLAPLSERQQEALETGLNPQLFEFVPEDVAPEMTPLSPNIFTYEDGEPLVQELPSGPVAVVPDVPQKDVTRRRKAKRAA